MGRGFDPLELIAGVAGRDVRTIVLIESGEAVVSSAVELISIDGVPSCSSFDVFAL